MPKPAQPILTTDKVRFVGDPDRDGGRGDREAGEGRRRGGVRRHRHAAGGHRCRRRRRARRAAAARRRRPATWSWISITATPRRSRPRSPRPRMSPGCRSATAASSSARWSRARPSASTIAATGRWTLRLGCQGVFGMRQLADRAAEGAGREDPRADRQCRRLVRHEGVAAIRNIRRSCTPRSLLGRPVKWTDERGESFLSDSHGRDHDMEQPNWRWMPTGKFLALRVTGYGNIGAYLSQRARCCSRPATS